MLVRQTVSNAPCTSKDKSVTGTRSCNAMFMACHKRKFAVSQDLPFRKPCCCLCNLLFLWSKWVILKTKSLSKIFPSTDKKQIGRYALGLICSKLPDCEKFPVVSFKPIKCDLPHHSADDLGNDRRYLFQIPKVIKSGECPEVLASMNPGKTNKARWLTSANRILRLHIATKFSLVVLASRFEATRGLFWDGPRNFEPRSDDEDDT
ncbi:hypothetical protein AVEN_99646-1 [Araneus ventricosus]|uniref:Uncharacterized protein n=1 Tax=Araneus ventricosus TaxID=182803 RepID=A0A4Y2DPK5_ARAVE|nr:hypothetical protein AVEN_99646-1 [Araneus ventricosus]